MLIEDKEYTLRFRMYMQANGLKVGDSVAFYQFSGWISDMWRKFKKSKGIPEYASITNKMQLEFDSWLEKEVTTNGYVSNKEGAH